MGNSNQKETEEIFKELLSLRDYGQISVKIKSLFTKKELKEQSISLIEAKFLKKAIKEDIDAFLHIVSYVSIIPTINKQIPRK